VGEVNRSVKEDAGGLPAAALVTGRSPTGPRTGSGHRYFTLKDDQAQIRCVMFRSDARLLPIDPDDGMNVRRLRRPHALRGARRVSAERAPARGAGRGRTLAHGVREAEEEARPPRGCSIRAASGRCRAFPRSVGIVTSTTGAALRDILTVLRRPGAVDRALSCARAACRARAPRWTSPTRSGCSPPRAVWTCLIVGRGGGSIEDLWAFNEEAVARAIAACPLL